MIGRWLTVDPYGQYASPYLGMGNNLINGVDPDGGFFNPVVGSDGKFRGFDDKGPGGEAIVYDGAFTDGMSQAAILDGGGMFFNEFASLSNFTSMEYQTFRTIYLKTFEHYLQTSALIETGNLIKDIALGLSFMTGGGSANTVRGASARLTARGVGTAINSVDDVLASPHLLKGKSLGEVQAVIGKSKGWINSVMTKTRGVDKGWVLRQVNSRGQVTGRNIQYHPGTHRHFGGKPYWKVSDGANVFRFPAN